MNQTEIAVTLLSFIYVLALTHVLQCFRDLWIARDRVKPSASHLIWMVALLLFAILTWFPAAESESGVALTGWRLGARLLFAMGVYFACAFVSPRVPDRGDLDMGDYEARNGAGFKLSFIALVILSLPLNYDGRSHGGAEPIDWAAFASSQWFLAVTAFAAGVSLWRREGWVRVTCAVVLLAMTVWGLLGSLGLR